ncbi:myotubularin-related protein 8 [Erpetoichthys calabaricus]|uniref:myotubularin-related protein 8 n=1 Tax=Erpetoichthys calabaricus TaxID=27687 RepID=UPI00223471CB|nr:myotubularin-related protein 8 [Erpetoichthys calabaricus]
MEHIVTPKVEEVKLLVRYNNKKPAIGTLYLTATHLIFVETSADVRKETWILHHHISNVEKLPLTATGCPLLIRCKNFRVVHFVIPRERDCQDVYLSLLKLCQPVNFEDLYAFLYNPKEGEASRKIGWTTVDVNADFQHMGLPNDYWEITDINATYGVCSTYPALLGVPKTASKPTIVGSSKFRSRGRFPVLSYFYKKNNATICRCSQPLSGFNARCVEDEQMLQAISDANKSSPSMYVVDTRPKLNAIANRAAGKGYENEDHYCNIKFQFVGIENIHIMRNSLQKLLEVCEMKSPSMSDYLTGLESSGWLRHIKAVMDAALFLVKAVAHEGASVLVHCSDGWDRTAQVCSLASLLLDPYYRTIKGLMVLIEKDWVSMGHKFSQRCGHLEGDSKEVSPVFTQFIECLWHLTEQFPCAFEFNEKLLLDIHDHVHSCQFGNFIGNCQKEREDLKLQDKTYSVWSFLLKKKQQYMNPVYKEGWSHDVLQPNTLPFNFKFWCAMYNRFDKGMHPRQSMLDHLLSIISKKHEEEGKMKELQKKISTGSEESSSHSHKVSVDEIKLSSPSAFKPIQNDSGTSFANGTELEQDGIPELEQDGIPSNSDLKVHSPHEKYLPTETFEASLPPVENAVITDRVIKE